MRHSLKTLKNNFTKQELYELEKQLLEDLEKDMAYLEKLRKSKRTYVTGHGIFEQTHTYYPQPAKKAKLIERIKLFKYFLGLK